MDKSKIHELTMLYLQKQDLSNLSTSEFIKKYNDTYDEIEKALKESKPRWIF